MWLCVNQEAGIHSVTAGFVFIYPNRNFQKLVQHSSYVEHHDHGDLYQVECPLYRMCPVTEWRHPRDDLCQVRMLLLLRGLNHAREHILIRLAGA